MFQFFPSIYIIISLYAFAVYFYSRVEYWLKRSIELNGSVLYSRLALKYSRRNFAFFLIVFIGAVYLSVIDCYMSV